MEHTVRSNLKPGMLVDIVLKKDQKTGILTRGIIERLLTSAPVHTRGIKVELRSGAGIGRVQRICTTEERKRETENFYRSFFSLQDIYSIWDSDRSEFVAYNHLNPHSHETERTAFIFEKAEQLKLFIMGTRYMEERFEIKPCSTAHLLSFFPKERIDYFRIQGERKISFASLELFIFSYLKF